MLVALLVILLSKPGDPVAFGIVGEFKNAPECRQAIQQMDIDDDTRSKLRCMEVKKQIEV